METRYLLPAYLLSYILVVMPAWPNPVGASQLGLRRFRTLAIIIVALLIFMAVVIHVTSAASSHLQFG